MQNEQNDDHYFDTIELENRVQFTGQAKLRNLLWEFIPYLTREKIRVVIYCMKLILLI